jgi:hypothetical protein
MLFNIRSVPIAAQLAIFSHKQIVAAILGDLHGYIGFKHNVFPGTFHLSLFYPLSAWGLLESYFPVATPFQISKQKMRKAEILSSRSPIFWLRYIDYHLGTSREVEQQPLPLRPPSAVAEHAVGTRDSTIGPTEQSLGPVFLWFGDPFTSQAQYLVRIHQM